ncbi:MAG TPA: pyruvate oxidase, partial [Cytophagales bacterium]|nr:pyruvate oxidase [Cytophagales bacterium]
MSNTTISWFKVLDSKNDLPEGRVTTAQAGHNTVCLTHWEGKICALDNACPHQGGPLGEGSIENGLLRCPWHGWDYHPCSGKAPGFDDGVDTYRVEEREDGVYVGLETEEPHERTVSDVMVETMMNAGVTKVFGMVGHSNLGFADAMRRQEAAGKLNYYTIRHEGAASFAASAYGKLTGKPAACFAIAGPGATNMYTGMWDAKVDRVPMLALSGQVDTQVVGTGAFQEVDLVAGFEAVAPFNHRVQRDSKHAELMTLAVKNAILRREVSHLTFPDEVQVHPIGEDTAAGSLENRITPLEIHPPKEQLDKAIGMIKTAKRPAIIMGHGARFHKEAIIQLAESLNCAVFTTFKGKGLISDQHELGCGVLGRSGTPIASWFMNEADLLLVFGASFSNHTGIAAKIPTIQVDYDPMTLAKFHPIECMLYGELSVTVEALRAALPEGSGAVDQRTEIAERWAIWRAEKKRRLEDDKG